MTRKAKRWTILIALPLLLIAAAIVALKLVLTEERLTALIVPPLESATHRSVKIERVSLRLIPPIGVDVFGLQISNRPDQGFTDRPMLELPELTVDLKLWPLLKKRLEVNAIVLKQPTVFIEITRDGRSNLSFAEEEGPSAVTPPETGAEAGRLESLLLADLGVSGGKFALLDHRDNSITAVEDLNARLGAEVLRGGEEVYFESESHFGGVQYGNVENPFIKGLSVSLKQRSTLYPDEHRLEVQSATLILQKVTLEVKGSVTSLDRLPNLNLHLSASTADLTELLASLPEGTIKTVEGLSTSGRVQIELALQGPMGEGHLPDARGTLAVQDGSIHYPGLPKAISNISLASSFEQSASVSRFTVETLTAQVGSNTMRSNFVLTNFSDPRIQGNLEVSVDLAEVKDFYPVGEGVELFGTLKANVQADGLVNRPQTMKSSGKVDLQGVSYQTGDPQKSVRNLGGRISFSNQNIVAPNVSFLMGESDFLLSIFLQNYLSYFFKPVVEGAKPYARVSIRSNRMDVSLAPGKEPVVLGALPIDMDSEVSIAVLNLGEYQFRNVRGSLSVRGDTITLKSLTLNTYDGSVSASGTLGFQDVRHPDFDLTLDVSNLQAHEALTPYTQLSKHLFGSFSMQSSLRGKLTDAMGVVPSTVSGEGKVQIREGKLEGMRLLDVLANSLDVKELKNIEFKQWSNGFTMSNGRILVSDAKIGARDADFLIGGSQGIDGSMDYALAVKLSPAVSDRVKVSGLGQELINALKDDEGRLTLNFRVTGTLNDPVLKLDAEAQKRAAEEVVRKEVEKKREQMREEAEKKKKELEEKAKEKAKDIFEKLFPPKKKE